MNPKKAAAGSSHNKEWVPSLMGEAELNRMVDAGVLSDRVTTGWRPASGESYPMSHTDEVVVFKDYFYHGFSVPIHPFLCGLINYYGISLCNLSPNSTLHVSVFIHFCEADLGILRHFDLFRHFFCLKVQGDLDLGL